jgi:hypothetical protein
VLVLWVPVALAGVATLLAIATALEERSARVTVRLTMRCRTATPERCEELVATELARVLTAHGLGRQPDTAH